MVGTAVVPNVEGTVRLPAAPSIVDAFTSVDYSMEASLNDLVDNSIDAGASGVLVRILRTTASLVALLVVDNGHGMDRRTIDTAMTFGGSRDYSIEDLGMFGMGLKSASLSQAETVSVISRARRCEPVGRQWRSLDAKRDWTCGLLNPRECDEYLDRSWVKGLSTRTAGTVVRLDDVRDFRRTGDQIDGYVSRLFAAVKLHLGLNLHRRLADRRFEVFLDVVNEETGEVAAPERVEPVDPFGYPVAGSAGYPKHFKVEIPGAGALHMEAHIWPARSKLLQYKLGGAVARRQGFYFYRNDRVIQGGGWNGVRDDTEPHLSLARIAVDLPPELSDFFRVRFTKAGVDTPKSFIEAVRASRAADGTTFDQYIQRAQEVYRTKAEPTLKPLLSTDALPAAVVRSMETTVGLERNRPIEIRWERLPADEMFRLDRADEVVLIVNSRFRPKGQGARRGANDGALLKTLLFLLAQEALRAERESAIAKDTRNAYSRILAAAAKADGGIVL